MQSLIFKDICGTCRHWENEVCWCPTSYKFGEVVADHKVCDQWLQKILNFVVK